MAIIVNPTAAEFKQMLAEKKTFLVDFYATWCGPCKMMAKNIFPTEKVGEYMNAHFVNLKIDMETAYGSELAKKLIGKFNYIIEFDRKGNNDAVFYDCDNKDFEKFITKDFYKTNIGSFTDISIIAPYLKAAAVNLSCGYYKAHTKEEYVMWSEMETSMHEAIKILARTMDDDKFEYSNLNISKHQKDSMIMVDIMEAMMVTTLLIIATEMRY